MTNAYLIREVGTEVVKGYAAGNGTQFIGRALREGDPIDAENALTAMREGGGPVPDAYLVQIGMPAAQLEQLYGGNVYMEHIGIL